MALLSPASALAAAAPLGSDARTLHVASWAIAFEGLDGETAAHLDRRWGGFVAPGAAAGPDAAVKVVGAGPGRFLDPAPGEGYRLEGHDGGVLSYHLAARRDDDERWRAAVAAADDEPRERIIENLARLLVARLALRRGGLALHGAGVLRGGRAWVFAGPSRAGKSTAARLSRPDALLGDDFAVVLPEGAGWAAAAVPFDNAERAPAAAPPALSPLAGVFRLVKAERAGVARLAGPVGVSALIGCAAFPWAVPDLAAAILPAADAIVRAGMLSELRFGPDTDVSALLEGS